MNREVGIGWKLPPEQRGVVKHHQKGNLSRRSFRPTWYCRSFEDDSCDFGVTNHDNSRFKRRRLSLSCGLLIDQVDHLAKLTVTAAIKTEYQAR
jgi:hypothetical protein